jgi:hypothetical protein
MNMRDLVSGFLLVAVLAIVIIVLVGMMMTAKSMPSETCLTYKQARQQWPNSYLAWRTKSHCWYNPKRQHQRQHHRIKKPERDPIFGQVKAEAPTDTLHDDERDACCWPPLEYDANDNLISPARSFDDRWLDTLPVWRAKE